LVVDGLVIGGGVDMIGMIVGFGTGEVDAGEGVIVGSRFDTNGREVGLSGLGLRERGTLGLALTEDASRVGGGEIAVVGEGVLGVGRAIRCGCMVGGGDEGNLSEAEPEVGA
jgi:hypothetical protein